MATFIWPILFYWPASTSRDHQALVFFRSFSVSLLFSVENAIFYDSFGIKMCFDKIYSEECAFYFHNLCSVNVYDV